MMFVQNKKGLLGLALILCFVAVVLIVAESEARDDKNKALSQHVEEATRILAKREASTSTTAKPKKKKAKGSTTKGPGKSTTKGPGKSTTKGSAKSATKGPGKSTTKGPGKSTTKGPGKSTTKGSAKSGTKGPDKSTTKAPSKKSTTSSPTGKSSSKKPDFIKKREEAKGKELESLKKMIDGLTGFRESLKKNGGRPYNRDIVNQFFRMLNPVKRQLDARSRPRFISPNRFRYGDAMYPGGGW